MKKLVLLVLFSVLFAASFFAILSPKAQAAFTSNNLMADVIFEDSGAMSAGDINNFLNSLSSSCISPISGFEARVPNGYSPAGGFTFGDFSSAGQVIATASQVYGINPRVLLVTLQKEQSLVTGGGGCNDSNENEYAAAMGYGCPDSGTSHSWTGVSLYRRSGVEHTIASSTCVSTSAAAGFSQQVIRGAWLLKFGEQRSKGNTSWAVVTGNWNNSDDPGTCYGGPMTQGNRKRCSSDQNAVFYDGYTTIDGVSTHMDSGATAALYWYTPHFSGNQHFYNLYVGWWGSPYITTPYAWGYMGQGAYLDPSRTTLFNAIPTVAPGGSYYMRLKAENLGAQTWDPSFMHLGTSRPNDRISQFADSSWTPYQGVPRPAQLSESSLLSGDTGTFDFILKAPNTPGSSTEYFNLVADGRTWLNDPGFSWTINVVSPVGPTNSTNTTLASGTTLNKGGFLMSPDSQSVLSIQREGNLVLRSNFDNLWNTGSLGSNVDRLVMQSDGNLVLYNTSNQALWSSQTQGNPGARLELQTDGNMVVYSASNVALWATYTIQVPNHLAYVNTTLSSGGLLYPGQRIETADRRFKLILQGDGNLVLYSPTKALWATGTDGRQVSFLAMQGDGNLVLYDKNFSPLWSSRTADRGSLRLIMQSDGNLVLYNRFNTPFWNTETAGAQ